MSTSYHQFHVASTSSSRLDAAEGLKRKRSQTCSDSLLVRRKRRRSCSDLTSTCEGHRLLAQQTAGADLGNLLFRARPSLSVLYRPRRRIPHSAYLQPKGRRDVIESRPKVPLPLRQLKSETPRTRIEAGNETDLCRLSQSLRNDVRVTFEYGVTHGNVAPCFYPGATIPLVIRSNQPVNHARIRTVLVCRLDLPTTGEITRLERWHDAPALSTLDTQLTLGLTLPLSTGGPASHDTPDGIFGVSWRLYVELHVGYDEDRKLLAAFNRSLTILPSTAPTPPVLLEPVELHPVAKYEGKGDCEITGWTPEPVTMRVGLDASSFSPNSIVPVHIDFQIPLGQANDDVVEVEASLVRTQQILLRAPGQPDHHRSTRHIIDRQSTTIPSTSPTADVTFHFHLASEDGAWPYGYTNASRLDDHTRLSNRFTLELTARQGRNVGISSTPIVIGSVGEPMNAMYILRGGVVSNESGWKVPPPAYADATARPAYNLESTWPTACAATGCW